MNKILIFYAYKSLDRKWYARTLLKELKSSKQSNLTDDDINILNDIATSSFKYCERYHDRLQEDKSLSAITKLCNNDGLMYDVMGHDAKLFLLSRTFNQILESGRTLHRCYDCGTNARAIFMQLIEAHRGKIFLTTDEQTRMRNEYQLSTTNTINNIDKCYNAITVAKTDTVFLLSLGIDDFGHVWVIEKRLWGSSPLPHAPLLSETAGRGMQGKGMQGKGMQGKGIQGKTQMKIRYHMYQSSFRSHMLLDYIEEKDYGRNPNQSLDIDLFFKDFKSLMSHTDAWLDEHYRLFALLFSFMPANPVINPTPGFCFTSITYDLDGYLKNQ